MAKEVRDLVIENAELIMAWRNFAGNAKKFNQEGDRNFCVIIPEDSVENLIEAGWNIKTLKSRDEEDEPKHYLSVSVRYGYYPPNIYIVKGKTKTKLTEETVRMLDWAEITNVDVVIRGYCYEVNGREGVKAYVKTMYVTTAEDPFATKYDNDAIAEAISEDDPF